MTSPAEAKTRLTRADCDITVFKCKACGKLDGYRILLSIGVHSKVLDDNDFDRKAVARAPRRLSACAIYFKRDPIAMLIARILLANDSSRIQEKGSISQVAGEDSMSSYYESKL
jgi:hypothetical protein